MMFNSEHFSKQRLPTTSKSCFRCSHSTRPLQHCSADHLHLFCAPRDLRFSIETWITYWKREFSLNHGRKGWKFQPRGWHHRLRDGEGYSEKWAYVQGNP